MEKLWAPWRLEYIKRDKPAGCVFCLPEDRRDDAERLVLLRLQHSFVIMNRYPYTNGHLLVAPLQHTDQPGSLEKEAVWEIHRLMLLCQAALQQAMGAEGFNVGWNIGAAAGAGIAEHIHLHIVPRWQGDINFMPVLADVRVIPEHLEQSYAKLKPALHACLAAE